MSTRRHPLVTALRRVKAIDVPAKVVLKGATLSILQLARPGPPRQVWQFDRLNQLNSAIGVARARRLAVFADEKRLYTVDALGRCSELLDVAGMVVGECELNWELAADDALDTVYATLLNSAGNPRGFRIVRADIASATVSEIAGVNADSTAYVLDPQHGRVVWLASSGGAGEAQELVVREGSHVQRLALKHRYHRLDLSPRGERAILSSLIDDTAIAVVPLGTSLQDQELPERGCNASWAGPRAFVYHVENRSFVWQSLDGGSRRHLASLGSAFTPSPGPFAWTKSNSEGTLLVWTWMADDASGVQHCGTLVLSLERAEYRSLDDYWHNVALLDE
jgi:hypothetical protein